MDKYIIVGKAASGKDWLQRRMVEKGCVPMKQYTTREKREIESGDEYHFISESLYKEMEANGEFVSSNFYAIGWYGISINELKSSDVAILSPANVSDIFKKYPELKSYFTIIYLDMPIELRRKRLNDRYISKIGDDNERRIAADEKDFKDFSLFNIRLTSVDEIKKFINNFTFTSVGR